MRIVTCEDSDLACEDSDWLVCDFIVYTLLLFTYATLPPCTPPSPLPPRTPPSPLPPPLPPHTPPPPLLPIALFDKSEVVSDERKPNHLIIAISSDRGLCGGIHSNVFKAIRSTMAERPANSTTNIVCIGDKVRTILQRKFRKNILLGFSEVGKKPPVFVEASFIARQILSMGVEFESAEIVYNKFRNVISYRTTSQFVVPFSTLSESGS